MAEFLGLGSLPWQQTKGARGYQDRLHFNAISIHHHGCRAFGITNQGLCVGTANPFFGAQVWKLSSSEAGPGIFGKFLMALSGIAFLGLLITCAAVKTKP